MFDWFWNLLASFGLSDKKGKIAFVGLDNAGKTSLLSVICTGKMTQSMPTQFASCGELQLEGLKLTTYDLGGHKQARHVWYKYFPAVSGIVFIVDCNERSRFEEAREELHGLMQDDIIKDVPLLVLGNKIDIPGAANEGELRSELDLYGRTTGKSGRVESGQRPIELFMCTVLKQEGYGDAFRWLAGFI